MGVGFTAFLGAAALEIEISTSQISIWETWKFNTNKDTNTNTNNNTISNSHVGNMKNQTCPFKFAQILFAANCSLQSRKGTFDLSL